VFFSQIKYAKLLNGVDTLNGWCHETSRIHKSDITDTQWRF